MISPFYCFPVQKTDAHIVVAEVLDNVEVAYFDGVSEVICAEVLIVERLFKYVTGSAARLSKYKGLIQELPYVIVARSNGILR